jgi:hypothetical protein
MKICPKCRRQQENPSHLGCEKCKVSFVDANELVTNFTRDELKIIAGFLLKDWRVYVVAGIFLAIGVGLLYWQAHEQIRTQIQKFQTAASNQVVTAYSDATNQLAIKFEVFAQDASNQVTSAYSSVTNQIAVEFQTPRIKQIVESVAKGEAKEILETSVQPEVDRFRADAELLRLATRARAYDFNAYQQLLELETQTNDAANLAKEVIAEIDRLLERDRINNKLSWRIFTEYSDGAIYEGPFTSDELARRFQTIEQDPTRFNREGFIYSVRDLKQPLFLPQLVHFLGNETDLSVADLITLAISDLTKEDFHPHNLEQIKLWWETHQNTWTNWPLSELDRGSSEFSMVHYSEAAKSFTKVLQIDPTADMSRAFAIACYWETGETNKAVMLAKEFQNPSGRWAKWALAKAELETGNISNATVHLAAISTNFPTMLNALPKQGYDVWKKVDWQLFNKLTTNTNSPLTK